MKKLVIMFFALVLSACQLSATSTQAQAPTLDVNAVSTAAAGTAIAAYQATQSGMSIAAVTPVGPQGTPANPNPVDCKVRTFIKEGANMSEQEDAYIVLGEWSNGHATFQTARVCEYFVAKGMTSYDVIWDKDADNVSVVFPYPAFSWDEVKAIGVALGFARVAVVQTHPSGRSCIDYDIAQVNPAFGGIQYFHGYDRADWSANPVYYCPVMVIPTVTPLPR